LNAKLCYSGRNNKGNNVSNEKIGKKGNMMVKKKRRYCKRKSMTLLSGGRVPR
jgi:hypothetical protein